MTQLSSKRLFERKSLVVFVVLVSQTACSGNYRVESNISREKWDAYYKHTQVTIYPRSALEGLQWQSLGVVEGLSCQQEPRDPPPTPGQARTELRRNAANRGANGVVDLACIPDDEPIAGCQASISCFGEAVLIQDPPQ